MLNAKVVWNEWACEGSKAADNVQFVIPTDELHAPYSLYNPSRVWPSFFSHHLWSHVCESHLVHLLHLTLLIFPVCIWNHCPFPLVQVNLTKVLWAKQEPQNSCKGSTASPKPRIWILRVCMCRLVPACLSVFLARLCPPSSTPVLTDFLPTASLFPNLHKFTVISSWHASVITVGSTVLWSGCTLPGHNFSPIKE